MRKFLGTVPLADWEIRREWDIVREDKTVPLTDTHMINILLGITSSLNISYVTHCTIGTVYATARDNELVVIWSGTYCIALNDRD